MTSVSILVQRTTREMTPADTQLPGVVWSGLIALNKVHSAWRFYRRIELYRNPDNFAQLLAGHAVNFVVGDYLLIKIAAQCVLIATRILECVEEQVALYHECVCWKNEILGRYPEPIKVQWLQKSTIWFSPSMATRVKQIALTLFFRMQRIILATLNVFKRAFKLSMKMMDAMETFSLSPTTHNEGVNQIFVNAIKWLDTIVGKKEELIQGVAQNREIIQKILKNSPFTYEQLYEAVSNTLEGTENIYHHANKISRFGNGMIINFGKRLLNAGMVVSGLGSLRPTFLA